MRLTACLSFFLLAACSDSTGLTLPDACVVGEVPEVPCPYPEGSYAARRVDDLVGPAYWPCSIKASEETYPLDHASFEIFHCDPAVQSIVIFFAAQSDSDSPERIREMVSLKDHSEEYGSKWIWVLVWDEGSDLPTPAMARSYYEEHGVTFGWFTDDEDNTWEPYVFHNHVPGGHVPSTWVIDAETMQIVYQSPYNLYGIIQSLGTD